VLLPPMQEFNDGIPGGLYQGHGVDELLRAALL
jgi:hypothetical protein